MSTSRKVFQDISLAASTSPVVIFDLDSTLFDVSPRTQAILDTFLKLPHVQEQHPKEYSLLRTVQIQSGDWGLRQPLEKMGFQSTPDFHKTLREYWRQHFFSSQFLHHDQPYVGAIEYVTALQDIGAQIYYLTGRDQ